MRTRIAQAQQLANAFVFSAGGNPVRDVMVGGKWAVH